MQSSNQVALQANDLSNNRNYIGAAKSRMLRELVVAGGLLTAVLLVFFGRSLLPGRVLSAADGILSTPFFAEVSPGESVLPSNALLFDQVYQFAPWRYFAREALNHGELPLWNPYSYAGTPLIATMQSAVFYPINLLLTFVPFEATLVWSAFIRLWIAGICTYLLSRCYGLELAASLLSAISLMLSGFLVVWLGHPNTNVAVWLPALILLGEIMLRATHKSEILLYMALLAIVIGTQFTGGHIETSVNILFTFGLYYVLRWMILVLPLNCSGVIKLKYLILYPGVATILGTALAAIQLAPFLEWLSLSAELSHREGLDIGFKLINSDFWRKLIQLPVILFPNIYNNPTWNDHLYWPFSSMPGDNYNESVLYVGTTTLLLALIAIFTLFKKEPLVKVWIVIGLIAFGRAFYLPVFDWLNQLPIITLAQPDRYRFVFSFALCILAGFGLSALGNSSFPTLKLAENIFRWGNSAVIVSGLIILLVGNIVLPTFSNQIIAYGREQVDIRLANRDTPPNYPLEHYYAQIDEMVNGLLAAFRIDNIAMYAPIFWALAGLLALLWTGRYDSQKIGIRKIVLLGLAISDLIVFGKDYNPSIPVEHFYPSTSIVRQIQEDKTLFRSTILRQDLIPDAHMMFEFQDVRGLDYPTHWYDHYMSLVPDRISWLSYGIIFDSVNSPFLQILNIKYVAASDIDLLAANTNIRIIGKTGAIYLGELVNTTPRAFIVYEAVGTNNDEEAAQLLRNEPESMFHRVILSEVQVAPSLTTNSLSSEKNIVSNVLPIEYGANHSTWQVTTSENGYLFLSDAYYPGWKASLNNQPTELYRANIAFRAVFVPKGEHTVSFRYEPTSIFAGAAISTLSVVIIFIFLILAYRYTLKSEKFDKQNTG